MKERILEQLQALRSMQTREELTAADYAAGRSIDLIKAFCNIDEMPEELLGVAVCLAGWMLEGGMGAGQTGANAKSIREGDISISFAEKGFGANVTESEMLRHFMVELERYRRLYR